MVQFTVSPNLISAIKLYNQLSSTSLDDSIDIQQFSSIDHQAIHRVSQALQRQNAETIMETEGRDKDGAQCYTLESLLKGCSIYFPPKAPKPETTAEYKALMAQLRLAQEEKEYSHLTSTEYHPPAEEDEYTLRDLKSHLAIIANVLLSTFATAAAVWMAASSWDTPGRLALSFMAALLVVIAEVVVFGGYMRRIEEGKAEENKIEEVKEVITSYKVGTAAGKPETK